MEGAEIAGKVDISRSFAQADAMNRWMCGRICDEAVRSDLSRSINLHPGKLRFPFSVSPRLNVGDIYRSERTSLDRR